jgi:predicted O-linked N-acetylglucosamine transferase (SPINDLY family)
MDMTLTARLIALTQRRDFAAVVAAWQRADAGDRTQEVAARMAAAAYAQLGDLGNADLILNSVLAAPNLHGFEASTWALAARISYDLNRFAESVFRWEHAVSLNKDSVSWWRWFADACIKASVPERALQLAGIHRVRINQDAELAITLVTLLVAASRCDEALIEFERVLAKWPHHQDAGPAFAEFVIREYPGDALELLERVQWRPQPRVLSPAVVRAAALLPAFYETSEMADRWWDRLLTEIRALTVLARESALVGQARGNCLATTPFFAAYFEKDVTEIQCAWGDFVEAVCAPLREPYRELAPWTGAVKSIGVISNRFTDSSAGRFFNPWLHQLKSDGFEVRLYSIGAGDAVTDALSQEFVLHRVVTDEIGHWQTLADRVYADSNDVLLYPEPQGSQLIELIAGLRLAPIQCAAFGNPLTTGLATMDYMLVPDAAEVAHPMQHYRERVVRLEGLGTTVVPSTTVGAYSRASFGFSATERIYLVSQQLQKWSPRFMDALIELLRRDARGRLVYFVQNSVLSSRAFELLLRRKFLQNGVDYAQRVTVVANLAREDYLALHRAADVGLDTFGFSGGSTTLDALSAGLPLVTLEGPFLRGRQSAAIMRQLGQSGNVAQSIEQFVDLAQSVDRSTVASGAAQRHVVVKKPHTAVTSPIFLSAGQFFRALSCKFSA